MITIKDIAREAGVSIGTVDRVLHKRGRVSEETTRKIQKIVEETGYKPNSAAQGLAANKKKFELCFAVPDPDYNPFFRDVVTGAQEKAKELKERYGVTVRFCYLYKDLLNAQIMQEKLKELDSADGVAALGVNQPDFRAKMAELEKKQIPVVLFNCDLPDVPHLSYVGCDYVKGGRLAAGLCAFAGTDSAKVCVFSQEIANQIESYVLRMDGFRREMAERYPQMQIVDLQEISRDEQKNEETVREMLVRHPDISVAYVVNPLDYKICKLLHKAFKKQQIRIITNDLADTQEDMVRDGVISATICQEPEKQGAYPLDILFQYLANGIVPENKIYTNLTICTAQNIP